MRVAHLTDGLASSVNADLELGRRLTEAGHEVHVLSPADVAATVTAAGFDFHRLDADQEFIAASATIGWAGVTRPRQWLGSIQERRLLRQRSIENDEVATAVAGIDPDVLLLDFEMHFARFATAKLQLPTLLTTVFFSVYRRPGLPPLDSTTSPAEVTQRDLDREWVRHLGDTRMLEWRQRAVRSIRADWSRPARYDSMDVDTLRQVARHHGVDPGVVGRRDWQRPFTHPDLPTLSYNLFELELPHRPAPNLHYVGPMVRPPQTAGSQQPAEWGRFNQQRGSGRPLVYCSLGTYWATDHTFLRTVVATFERRTDWDLVIGLGSQADPAQLGPLPSNVLALAHAPQIEVLTEADACITHGGATTLAECVALAVPVVVYSTGHVDQNGNATRVAFHQTGQVGQAGESATQIEARLEAVMADAALAERLAGLQRQVDTNRGRAVEVIEGEVARSASGQRS